MMCPRDLVVPGIIIYYGDGSVILPNVDFHRCVRQRTHSGYALTVTGSAKGCARTSRATNNRADI